MNKSKTLILVFTLILASSQGLMHNGDYSETDSISTMMTEALEESNLSILVISLTILIMLTSIYFIIKVIRQEWRWIENDS